MKAFGSIARGSSKRVTSLATAGYRSRRRLAQPECFDEQVEPLAQLRRGDCRIMRAAVGSGECQAKDRFGAFFAFCLESGEEIARRW